MAYRFAEEFEAWGAPTRLLRSLSGPLADFGVYLFFAISGYIITLLLRVEEDRRGQVSLTAFYIRRCLRILPPLMVLLGAIILLDLGGLIDARMGELPRAFFTCNFPGESCDWYIAHTWSLAVEEQFYLFWPVIFIFASPIARSRVAILALAVLVGLFAVMPFSFHSNPLSFSCITVGVLAALFPSVKGWCEKNVGSFAWLGALALAIIGPRLLGNWAAGLLMPALVMLVLFGSYGISWLRPLLVNRPVQWVAAMSYSLYLWQQVFLASPAILPDGAPPLPVWLLPPAAWGSMVLVERPSMRLARMLSDRWKEKRETDLGEQAETMEKRQVGS